MFFSFDSLNVLSSLILSLAVQALFFAFAAYLRTDKVTDLSYSLSFIVITAFLLVAERAFAPLQLLVALLVLAWAFRLGSYLFARILRMGKDERFDDKRGNFREFLKFWILQAFAVWVIMLPVTVLPSLDGVADLGAVSLAGVFLWAIGFVIEAASDAQKAAFKKEPANSGRWIDSGLWRFSRHPNYFGEILQWWGVFVAAAPAFPPLAFLTVAGPLSISLLILFVSGVPLLEKSADRKYGADPGYQDYKRRTSILVPLPPRKA